MKLGGGAAQATGARDWRTRLRTVLSRHVVWLTDARRDGLGAPSGAAALVLVLGREHYLERRRQYPVRGWRDLHRVLKLELADAPGTLSVIGPLHEDRREVTFFELRPGSAERIGRALWVVPETAALAAALAPTDVVTVERDGLRYFLAGSGQSQPAGGAIPTAELFALAVGAGVERPIPVWEREAARQRLLSGLRRMRPDAWLRLLRPSLEARWEIAWKPLATLAAGGLVVYLALASAWLAGAQRSRERALDSLGPEVETLLGVQREVQGLETEQRGIGQILAGRRDTYEVWRLAAEAWKRGARLTGLQLADSRLTLRGSAPAATDVLAAIAAAPGVADARFSAPVRREAAGEEFAISLTLTGAPAAERATAAARGRSGG